MNIIRIKQLYVALIKELRASNDIGMQSKVVYRDNLIKIRGGLFLAGDRAKKYYEAFEKILDAASPLNVWTRETLDELVAIRLAQALGVEDGKKIAEEADLLLSDLQGRPTDYLVKLAIFGLDLDCNAISFGQIFFVAERHAQKIPAFDLPAEIQNEVLFAVTTVRAINENAALELAHSRVDRHLSVLNAISSDYPPSRVRISRSFLADFNYSIEKITPKDKDMSIRVGSRTVTRTLHRADLEKILERHGGKLIGQLIGKDSSAALRLISAFETAGVACLESQPYIAFLLFAIALESAVLGKENREELTLQLALRTAHLLSASLSGRKQTFDRVKRLYRLRSKIVHSGSQNVLNDDVAEIKYICLSTLFSLLSFDQVSHFEKVEDLEDWFTTQLLDSKTVKAIE